MAIPFPTGAGVLARNVFPGRYFPQDGMNFSASSAAMTADLLYCLPFSKRMNLDALTVNVTTGAAGAVRMGLYECGVDGEPTSLIEEAAVGDTTSIALVVCALAAARRIDRPVWLVAVFSAAPTIGVTGVAPTGSGQQLFGSTGMTGTGGAYGFTIAYPYAALPAVFPSSAKTGITANLPALAVRSA